VLFTFPSRYLCTIGHRGVLRLGRWSSHVQTGFHEPRLTQGRLRSRPVRGCHPFQRGFPAASGKSKDDTGLIRFRSPLLAESLLMSFPPANEMFQFAGFASYAYVFSARSRYARGVAPFGNLWINACSRLPRAYRSVPRPSSPLGAKASARCPYPLPPPRAPRSARAERKPSLKIQSTVNVLSPRTLEAFRHSSIQDISYSHVKQRKLVSHPPMRSGAARRRA
jgi:hypothetical protein